MHVFYILFYVFYILLYIFSMKFIDFIEKRQLWTFKKMGVVFWRKKRPCGNTARSTQLFLQKNDMFTKNGVL